MLGIVFLKKSLLWCHRMTQSSESQLMAGEARPGREAERKEGRKQEWDQLVPAVLLFDPPDPTGPFSCFTSVSPTMVVPSGSRW